MGAALRLLVTLCGHRDGQDDGQASAHEGIVLHHCAGTHAQGNDSYRELRCFLKRFFPARLRVAERDPGVGRVCGGCRFLVLWPALKRRNCQSAWGGVGWPELLADRAPHSAVPRGGLYVSTPGIGYANGLLTKRPCVRIRPGGIQPPRHPRMRTQGGPKRAGPASRRVRAAPSVPTCRRRQVPPCSPAP